MAAIRRRRHRSSQSERAAGKQRPAAARQWRGGVGAGDRVAGRVHRRRAVGGRLAHPQPPVRGPGADGGADLGGLGARRRLRAGARQLLPASRDDREMMRRRTVLGALALSGRALAPGRRAVLGALALSCATVAIAAAPPPAAAFNPIKPVCGVGGLISGLVGKACSVLQKSSRLLSASKKLLSGHVGEAAKALVGGGVVKGRICRRADGGRGVGSRRRQSLDGRNGQVDRPDDQPPAADDVVLGDVLANGGHRGGADAAIPVRGRGPGGAAFRPRPALPRRVRLSAAGAARREHRRAADDAAARGVG